MVFFEENYPFNGVFRRCSLHYEKFQDGTVKCIEHEIPFEIPEGWEWSRFSSVTINRDSERKPISLKDRTDIEKTYDYYGASGAIDKVSDYLFDERLLLIGEDGANLITRSKPIAFFATGKYWVNNHAHCIDSTDKQYLDFICLYINSINLEKFITGAAQPKMNQDNMNSILVPFPPLNEQRSIVKFIVQMDAIIGIIRNNGNELAQLITDAKSQILDLAIRGKLVPQDPDDEPASVLLERIRAEKEELIKQGKIKRDKKESIIFKGDDNSYYEKVDGISKKIDAKTLFDIPENWHWERLGNISTIARGGSPRPIDDYLTTDKNGINWIKIGDAEQGEKYIYRTKEKIKPDGLSKTRYVKSGDFLLTNSMSFGRPYILKTDGCIHDGWLVVGNIKSVFNQDFLYYALSSDFMYNSFAKLAAGSTVKNLKSDTVRSVLFPVPPRQEQKRISQHLENLFYVLAKIEQRLS